MKKYQPLILLFFVLITIAWAATTEVRIRSLANSTTTPAADDYFVLDGATNGTRKLPAATMSLSTSGTIAAGNLSGIINSTDGAVGNLTLSNMTISGYNGTLSASGNFSTTLPSGNYTVGYANIPQNPITANYTTVATDASKNIIHTSAASGNHTVTVNNTAHADGDVVGIMNAKTGTTVTATLSSGNFTLYQGNLTSTGASASIPAGTWATLYRIGTGDWAIAGGGVTVP